jgi:outer membrane protein TolC
MARYQHAKVVTTTLLLFWFVSPPCPAQAPSAAAESTSTVGTVEALPSTAPTDAPQTAEAGKLPVATDPDPATRFTPSLSPPSPLPAVAGEASALKPPPLEDTDRPLPITLATALRLSDARPLIIAVAQARAWIAEARLQRAKAFWAPAIMINAAYLRHDGPIDFNGGINVPSGINALGQPDPGSFGKPINQNLNWFYAGASLYAVGSMTDAIFLPLVARQDLNARRWDIQAAKNDALLRTARAYFNVHRYRGQYAGAIYTVERGRKLVEAIDALRRDLVPAVEVDRARNLLADLEQQSVSAREEWRVASAELTRVLRLDPRAVVAPLEHDHLQITLIDPGRPLDELIPIGLTNRPELAAHQALVEAALVRIRQEKMRPLLPNVLITGWQAPGGMTTQIGILGTGSGGNLNQWSARDDLSLQLVWQAESFGFGNAARVKRERAVQSRALVELFRKQDEIAADITQTQADLQSASSRVLQAERSLEEGLITFNKSLEGLGQTQRFDNVLHQVFRPQEVVNALQQLKTAFDEYFDTVADYNLAQFELFHALGYPARDIAKCLPPGEVMPLDTSRPDYLPPVGTGPPPATR